MRGFTYTQDENYSGASPEFPEAAELDETLRRFGVDIDGIERAAALPITPQQAVTCARWMRRQFGDKMVSATAGTPFSAALLSAMVCQETAYFWLGLVDRLTPAEVLA